MTTSEQRTEPHSDDTDRAQVPRPRDYEIDEPGWRPESLDLAAYLDRIGYTGPREPTASVLREVHRAHAASIRFENLDLPIGRSLDVNLPAVERKLVGDRRGGYCFENNPLLAAVLTRLGFGVRRGSARGPIGAEQDAPIRYGMGHAISVVTAGEEEFLCDVGVGYLGPYGPIPLVDGAHHDDGGWRYRTDRVRIGELFTGWLVRIRVGERWSDLYAIGDMPMLQADYVDQNYLAATHPDSPFVDQLIVQRSGEDDRWTLRDLELTRRTPDGGSDSSSVPPEQLRDVLAQRFDLHLDDDTAAAVTRFVVDKQNRGPS